MTVASYEAKRGPLASSCCWQLCALYWAVGCSGRAVDLDTAPGADDATVFVRETQRIDGVWADGERLYWLATSNASAELKGCDVNACSETTTTYAQVDARGLHGMLVAVGGGRLAWSSLGALRGCAATDCQGKTQELLLGARLQSLACNQNQVCFGEELATYCCSSSGCDISPKVVAGAESGSLTMAGEYLYWVKSEQGSGEREVRRTRLDDLGTNALVTTTTGYATPFDVNSTSLYLVAADGPSACPLPACSRPAPLVSGSWGQSNAFVDQVQADDSNVYWLQSDVGLGQLKRCPLSGCVEPDLPIPNAGRVLQFALTADYLYWLEAAPGPLGAGGDGVAVRRIRK